MKKGDIALIIKGPPDKKGKIGTVTTLMENGVILKLGTNQFTPIKFEHLEQLFKCIKCKKQKKYSELCLSSQDLINNKSKPNHNVCRECDEKLKQEMIQFIY